MKFKLQAIKLSKSLTLMFKNKKHGLSKTVVFTDTHLNYKEAVEFLRTVTKTDLFIEKQKISEADYNFFLELHDTSNLVKSWSNGDLEITSTAVLYKGVELNDTFAEFLLDKFLTNPHEVDALKAWGRFLTLINSSNSYKVANRLFLFLQHNDLQIDADGNVLAWKVVRQDYRDKHSGKFDNSPGKILSMPRNQVDDNDNSHCSYGFHVCSWGYLRSFSCHGDPVMQVKINIDDIVAIPNDYNGEKIRVCKYEVLREVGKWGVDVDATRLPKLQGFSAGSILEPDEE